MAQKTQQPGIRKIRQRLTIKYTKIPFYESVLVDAERMELLVRLLTRHQEEIFRFILSLHPHEEDARDVLQETSVALCRKIVDYDPKQPFLPWAFGFAYLEVLKQRERNQRGARLLSRELADRLAKEREESREPLETRLQALEDCLQKLPPAERILIQQRYQGAANIEELVQHCGMSRRTLFRSLQRIRRMLYDCVNQRVAGAESP
jgi:RNA polymerase sigma-70 factor (ECF subfamily)